MVFVGSGSQCFYFCQDPSSLFHSSVLVDLKCFYDDVLTELVNHCANRTLIVSCTTELVNHYANRT